MLLAAEALAGAPARLDLSALERGAEAVEDSWLLVFEEGAGGPSATRGLKGRGLDHARSTRLLPRVVHVEGLDRRAVEGLLDLPGLERIVPDLALSLSLVESLPQVRGDAARLQAAGFEGVDGEGVRICVVDSGVRASHVALAGRVDLAAGRNTADGGSNTSDVEGHGTHVASIAAGAWPDGRSGVAPGATIVPVRACGTNRLCSTSAVIAGIDHCADPEGGAAHVLNLSLGGVAFLAACDSDPMAMAANAAVEAGLVVVAASGNDAHDDRVDTPACGSKVIAVGAVFDAQQFSGCGAPFSLPDQRACFSNSGPQISVVAPGAVITAADDAHDAALQTLQGTSMATPHVAGLAALLLQRRPGLTVDAVRAAIESSAVDLGPVGFDVDFGHGRIDVVAALRMVDPCLDCPQPDWGDVHPEGGDGSIDLADWLVLRRAALSLEPPAAGLLERGDLSPAIITCLVAPGPSSWCPLGDGAVRLEDVAALRVALAGLVSFACTPCPEGSASGSPPPGSLRRPADLAPPGGGDDVLDVADVLRLLQLAVGLHVPTAEELLRGDLAPADDQGGLKIVRGDGSLDVLDVLLALRAAVALIHLDWPARALSARGAGVGETVAWRLRLDGWPVWARSLGTPADCGLGGGLDVVGSAWTLTCASDPATRPLAGELGRFAYRGPEEVLAASLSGEGEALSSTLVSTTFVPELSAE